jgi:2',3'-cyclic-nucleotide 2'-phosphodiesterase
MPKLLFFGDIMGKPGRQALAQVLPSLREEYQPDVVIANVENLAHGKGVTEGTLGELADLGVDVFTSGNHVFDKGDLSSVCFDKYPNLIRPYNYDDSWPGRGYYRLSKNGQHYLIINLGGKVFFEKQFRGEISNPFFALDQVLQNETQKDDIILLDFHAEATSEKVAMGWYADGRIAAMLGTHTHVPTADTRILPKGTAYVTDVGMTGPLNSVIGVKTENSLNMFLEKGKFKMEPEEAGPVMANATLIELQNMQVTKLEKIYREINA